MVTAAAWLALALAATAPAHADAPDADRAVRGALGSGKYPWYDAQADHARLVEFPREPARAQPTASGNVAGSAIIYVLVALLVAGLIGLVFWAYFRADFGRDMGVKATTRPGEATREGALPAGLAVDAGDPWAEAARRRSAGDLAGAIVSLFAAELRTLDRLRLVRLAPGKTGRQLVRSVEEVEVRGRVEPALRLFEAVYYGHREPDADDFEDAWAGAEWLRRLAAERGTP